MYKLKIELKQHTPIIHFQHDQAGATLRATEVKPKLDRFILEKLGGGNYEKGKKEARTKGWLIDKDKSLPIDKIKGALDYKMRINCMGTIKEDKLIIEIEKSTCTIIPPDEETAIYCEKVMLIILSKHEGLLNELKLLNNEFFVKTSFGKRSNKGLGCFYPVELTWNKVKKILPSNTFFKFNCINGTTESNYKFISKINRIIKSGYNHNDYIKSKLFVYLINDEKRWDKRWIKKELNTLIANGDINFKLKANKAPNDWNDGLDIKTKNGKGSNNTWDDSAQFEGNYVFGRCLLGMSEHWEFLTDDDNYKYKVIPEDVNENIERYKSPISFKVFDSNLFVVAESINENLLNKAFYFKVQVKQRTNSKWQNYGEPIFFKEQGRKKTLRTPSNFNLNKFLNSCLPAQHLGFQKLQTN